MYQMYATTGNVVHATLTGARLLDNVIKADSITD